MGSWAFREVFYLSGGPGGYLSPTGSACRHGPTSPLACTCRHTSRYGVLLRSFEYANHCRIHDDQLSVCICPVFTLNIKDSHMGKARGYPWSYQTKSLALAWASLRGAPKGTMGNHEILDTRVIDWISQSQLSFHTLFISYLGCVFKFVV